MGIAPLEGITVVSVESWVAVPGASAALADMGARVIKVEQPGGDPLRNIGRPVKLEGKARHYDYHYDVDNRGKQSVAIAIDRPAGRELVHALAAKADIFMCNLLVDRQQRFGLDPETLLAINPRLVHSTFTGYGTEGPDAWRPGFDVTAFFGRSGLYDAMRDGEDGIVPQARPAQGDHASSLAIIGSILAALRVAERTGEGQVVESSLYSTAVWTQASDYAITAVDRAPVRPRARHEMILPTANRYPCGDGKWVVLNMPKESAWPKLCKTIGLDHLLDDERFADLKGRYRNMAEIVAAIDEALSAKSRDEWGVLFDAAGLIWGPVMGMHEVASDPQADAMELFPTIDHPDIGPYRTVGIPMRFRDADVRPRGPAAATGEHTREVLTDLGVEAERIDGLLADGTVVEPKG